MMLDRMRRCFGNHICSIQRDGNGHWDVIRSPQTKLSPAELMAAQTVKVNKQPDVIHFHSFPSPDQLACATQEDLRLLGTQGMALISDYVRVCLVSCYWWAGLGYRASFIHKTTQQVRELGIDWLQGLRQATRQEAQSELLKLTGVGMKVADCVALFSLDQHATVPIDTHVWRIASRDYDPSLQALKYMRVFLTHTQSPTDGVRLPDCVRSLTPTVYEKVGDIFRSRFGNHAGWAHSALFAAELTEFQVVSKEARPLV